MTPFETMKTYRVIFPVLILILFFTTSLIAQTTSAGTFSIKGKRLEIILKNKEDTTLYLPNHIRGEKIDASNITRAHKAINLTIEHDKHGKPGTANHVINHQEGILAFEEVPPKENRKYSFIIPKIYLRKKRLIKVIYLSFKDGRQLKLQAKPHKT